MLCNPRRRKPKKLKKPKRIPLLHLDEFDHYKDYGYRFYMRRRK